MSLRSFLISRIAERITGAERQASLRARAERRRRAANEPHRVDYFHQNDDPYSHLVAQVLPLLAARYDIDLRTHVVSAPEDWAAPERAKLVAWSQRDASRLAAKSGLSPHNVAPITGDTAAGDALRQKLGHYLGATLHYGGEWYWGLDRLHFLEQRLADLGVRKPGAPAAPIYAQPASPLPDAHPSSGPGGQLHYYLSFRSPYTYIAAERAKALADAYGLDLKLRFVLPMVMRGLPVPPAKRNYITLDAAREARRAGVPFGRIADPVGRPVERGYSLIPWAVREGRGFDYCLAFMRAVWSQGVDAGSDAGMRRIVEAAGLDWSAASVIIDNTDWRAEAEDNRHELMSLGLWGVPSFRFNDIAAWGQDRLWVIEDAIRAAHARS